MPRRNLLEAASSSPGEAVGGPPSIKILEEMREERL
jgi:hypothetical protein